MATDTDRQRRNGFIDYLLERKDVRPAWHEYTHHEFVERMGDGTLPPETFKYYMIQDYLYLVRSEPILTAIDADRARYTLLVRMP